MKNPTLLVVAVEQMPRRLLTDVFSPEGIVVETCDAGQAALRRLEAGGIELVIADLAEGERLLASRRFESSPEVLLVAACADREQAIATLQKGAGDFLSKPVQPDELRHRVLALLEKRRLAAENEALHAENGLLREGLELGTLLDLEPLLARAVPWIQRELGATAGFAFVRDDEDFSLHAVTGMEQSQAQSWAPLLFSGLSSGPGPWHLDVEESQALQCAEPILAYPLYFQDQLRGGLVFVGAARFVERAELLFKQTALAFENAFRLRGARELMYTDDLTGLFNHRYLHLVLEQEIRRSGRYRLEFALVFIDLDHFKAINDTHGHLVGSAVLTEVGQVLRQCLRDTDLLFRYGGDEFTALLVETEEEGALVVAERMRATLEHHKFLAGDGVNARLTATFGVAVFPGDAEDRMELLLRADRAMYWGKKHRNVVCRAQDLKDV